MRWGSVAWHHSLPLMSNFNKTKLAIFPMQAVFSEGFIKYPISTQNLNIQEDCFYNIFSKH